MRSCQRKIKNETEGGNARDRKIILKWEKELISVCQLLIHAGHFSPLPVTSVSAFYPYIQNDLPKARRESRSALNVSSPKNTMNQ